jgi:hypothetical protein
MNQISGKQQSRKPNPYVIGDNVLETVRSIGSHVGKVVQNDIAQQIPNDILRDIFGTSQSQKEVHQNETIDIPEKQSNRQPGTYPESMRPVIDADMRETKEKLEAIRNELQMLAKSIKGFHQEVEKAILEMPVNPGVYHINFFEQLRSFIQLLRETLDDSRVWLQAFNTNSKKKRGYWGQYKKHGTTFGLSNERSLATQAG